MKDLPEYKVQRCEFKDICKYRDGGCDDNHILLTLGCLHRENTARIIKNNQKQNEFNYPGFKRISELARHDVVIARCLDMFGSSQCTWEEVKIEMILYLSKYNKETMDQMNNLVANSPPYHYINKDFI